MIKKKTVKKKTVKKKTVKKASVPAKRKILPEAMVRVNTQLSRKHRLGLELVAEKYNMSMQSIIRKFLDEGLKRELGVEYEH